MMNLALAMLSSMMVSFTMRLSEGRTKNNVSMLAMNYAMCSVLAVLHTGSLSLPENTAGLGFTAGWGVLTGAMYLSGFLLLQWNIRKNGVVLPATFMKLGVVVPTLLSIVAFGELPSVLQVVGIVLAVAAIILINTGKADAPRGKKAGSAIGLVALLMCGGLTDFISKIYEETGNAALSNHYLLFTFAAALLLCVLLAASKKQSLTLKDVGFGALIGVPNYYSAKFLLASLASVPAVVAYPTVNVGTIVLVALCGMLVFGERLTRRQWTAMGVILVSLALLNL